MEQKGKSIFITTNMYNYYINCSIESTKLFLIIQNKLQIKNLIGDGERNFYDGVEYDAIDDNNIIYVNPKSFKGYYSEGEFVKYNKHNLSYLEIGKNLNKMYDEYFDFFESDIFYDLDKDAYMVEFNKKYTDYEYNGINYNHLTVNKNQYFTSIDLLEFMKLRNKTQIFLYLKLSQMKKGTFLKFRLDEFRDLTKTKMQNCDIVRNIKKEISKVAAIMNINIKNVTLERNKNKISNLRIDFNK